MTGWTGYEISLDELGSVGDVTRREAAFVVQDLPGTTLPDVDGPLALRTYATTRGTPAGLRGMANMRATLPVDLRDRLDAVAAWPVRTVIRGGALRGVVQRRLPERFLQDVTLPSGRIARVRREAQFLFTAPARAAALGLAPLDEQARLGVCLALAVALDLAHRTPLEFALGDVDSRSVLYAPGEHPAVLLADFEGARLRGSSAPARRGAAPDWDPPPDPADAGPRAADLYKLGLFVLRCLCPGPFGSVLRDPDIAAGTLDLPGAALLRRALSPAAAGRPSAHEWRAYLSHRLGRALDAPRVTVVRPDRTLVAVGEPLSVHWEASDAATVTITGLGVDPVRLDRWPAPGAVEVRPVRTGRLHVTARNELGEHTRFTGPIAVVDVPRTASLGVPIPDVPWPLADIEAPPLPSVAPPLPLVSSAAAAADAAAFWPPPALPPSGSGTGSLAFPFDLTALFDARAPGPASIPAQRGGEAP